MANELPMVFEGRGIILKGARIEREVEQYYEGPGCVLIPEEVKGAIYFVHGLSARWSDYRKLLHPLSSSFDVLAYDQRGHGSSPGVYSPKKAADDLEAILEREEVSPVGLLGHSIGCRTAVEVAKRFEAKGKPLNGVYLLQPYLGVDSFGNINKKLFKAASVLYPFLSPVDLLLTMMPFVRRPLGLNQVFPLYTSGAVSRVNSSDCEGLRTPAGYMLADNDGLLGTSNQKHYFACMDRLRGLFSWQKGFSGFPIPWDESNAAMGLNHCFNYKGDRPFLKDEVGKDANKIIGNISGFFSHVF